MLKELYREVFGVDPGEIEAIASSGSNRRNYRVFRDEALGDDSSVPASVIFTEGQSVAENNAFIQLARYFYSMGLPVPNIYGVSDDRLCYLQKDLGYDSLFEHLDNMELVKKAVCLLADFQFSTGDDFDYSFCYPQRKFDGYNNEFDLHYFKNCFLKLTFTLSTGSGSFKASSSEDSGGIRNLGCLAAFLLMLPSILKNCTLS